MRTRSVFRRSAKRAFWRPPRDWRKPTGCWRDLSPPVRAGLEGAVAFGTAQHARVAGVQVAGKTGSAFTAEGEHVAWFAGFMPSREPDVVVVVMLRGRSGGADAAPVAGRILEAYRARRL